MQEIKKILEEFVLVHATTGKTISVTESEEFEVRSHGEMEGIIYKTLRGAIKSASK